MNKIYIVTAGKYSDYHIERVFSTKKKAQEYLDHFGNANNANMVEYDLDKETPRGVFGYCVFIYEDGSATAKLTTLDDNNINSRRNIFQYLERLECYGRDRFWFNVEAKDAPHAIKIASERLMQINAMPYLFPRVKDECACRRLASGNIYRFTPIYDYNTKEIILDEGEWIE